MNEKKGILLVNLGTPSSPNTKDVKKYLDEFLSDPRVMDISPIGRFFLVKSVILPSRSPKSAETYQKIWTEKGSPLLFHSERQKELLSSKLGEGYQVELAMRYQEPSIASALNKFKENGIFNIKVVPLFPQYASATTGTVHQLIMTLVKDWQIIPNITFLNSYADNPLMIKAFADLGKKSNFSEYDHILFSFHGLPKRQLIKADYTGQCCLKDNNCCETITKANRYCYSAQCYQTTQLIAQELQLPKDRYTVCFQSRLGKDPWIEPYTSDVIHRLAEEGKKKILVFCPAFTSDCLETLFEIAEEYHQEFQALGGEAVHLVPALNDHPLWIEALADIAAHQNV